MNSSPFDSSALPFASSNKSPVLLSDGTRIIAVGADRSGVGGVWVSGDGTAWQPVASSGTVPPIPSDGGAVGALGPQGIILSLTSSTPTGFSTSVWFGR